MFECCSLAEKARVMADNRWVLGIEVGHTSKAEYLFLDSF